MIAYLRANPGHKTLIEEVAAMKKYLKIWLMTGLSLLVVLSFSVALAAEVNEYDQYLIERLSDENIGVRASAAQLLGERKVEAAVKPLVKMLKSEDCYACRIVAARALYQIGTDEVMPILKKVAAKDKNKTVRHVVAALVNEMQNVKYAKK